MKKQAVFKIAADVIMTVALLLLMAFELIGGTAHEWIGVGMFVMFVLHHVLNRKWIGNICKGRYTPFRIFQVLLVFLVLICMLSSMVSGIVLSRHVFTFLPIQSGRSWARILHMLAAYWGFVFMSLHLGLHWNMMMGMAKWAAGGPSALRSRLLKLAGIVIAGYGVYAFIKRGIGSYMLLRTTFVFFDFEEPLVCFYVDYLAVMGLFVWIGHYASLGIRALSQKGGKR